MDNKENKTVEQPSEGQPVSLNKNEFVQKLVRDVKLLPRNKTEFPDLPQDEFIDSSSFIYALSLLGSGGDGNITSIVHHLWKEIAIAIQSGGLTEELQDIVKKAHDYLSKIGMF